MWTHFPSVEEEHSEAELQDYHALPHSHYGPNCKGKAQTSKWPHSGSEGLSYWCIHSD